MNKAARWGLGLASAFTAATMIANAATHELMDTARVDSILTGSRSEEIIRDCAQAAFAAAPEKSGTRQIDPALACTHQRQVSEIKEIRDRGQLTKLFYVDETNLPLLATLGVGLLAMGLRRRTLGHQP